MQSSASRLFALSLRFKSLLLPLCSSPCFSSASLLGAQHISAAAPQCSSCLRRLIPCLCASSAAPRNPLHRLRSSYQCRSMPSPILPPLPVSSPRRRISEQYDASALLCPSSHVMASPLQIKSHQGYSLPLRCPSSLCLCASVLVHAGAYPLNADPGLCRSYRRCAYPQPCVSDLIPAAAALRRSMLINAAAALR